MTGRLQSAWVAAAAAWLVCVAPSAAGAQPKPSFGSRAVHAEARRFAPTTKADDVMASPSQFRGGECINLLCPQFIMTGVGYQLSASIGAQEELRAAIALAGGEVGKRF